MQIEIMIGTLLNTKGTVNVNVEAKVVRREIETETVG